MMDVLFWAAAVLLYPGLLVLLVLAVLYAALTDPTGWRAQFGALAGALRGADATSREQVLPLLSGLLAAVGLALLPWPWHPAGLSAAGVAWLWSWLAFELAFLLPLLPAIVAGSPPVVHAGMRAAQIGVLGRALLWVALGAALLLHDAWAPLALNGHSPLLLHLLALVAAGLAFPAAVGWGPYTAVSGWLPDGPDYGLEPITVQRAQAAHTVRTAALLAACLVALLPVAVVPPLIGLILVLVAFNVVCLGLRYLAGLFPRPTLPTALQRTMWRVLPLGLLVVIYLSLVTGA
jgi:hypothetical protein